MDWYFGSGVDDFLVPEDQELYDRLPSPQSWSKWAINVPENFELLSKCFLNDAKLGQAEFNVNGNMLGGEVKMESSAHDKGHSSGSSVGGLSWESLHQSALSDHQSDYQLDGHAGVEQMDDIFLCSLLDDLPGTENFQKSFPFAPDSESPMIPADNLLSDLNPDSRSISSDSMGSPKYPKTHAFSSSVGWENSEVAASQFTPCNTGLDDWPKVKAPFTQISDSPEDNSTEGLVDEETSLEEYVLLELEMAMTQLTDKTRICFRDALYRLAKNSRQNMVTKNQNGNIAMEDSPWIGEHEVRSVGTEPMELETNSIDRAVASMMFNKMDLHVQDFPVSASISSNHEVVEATDLPSQLQIQGHPHYPTFQGDAGGQCVRQGHPQIRPNPDEV